MAYEIESNIILTYRIIAHKSVETVAERTMVLTANVQGTRSLDKPLIIRKFLAMKRQVKTIQTASPTFTNYLYVPPSEIRFTA